MANRITFSSQNLYVGPTGAWNATGTHTGVGGANLVTQLSRVQSINYNWAVNRQQVFQYGMQGLVDQPILQAPTAPLSFSYLLANLWNEDKLGLTVGGGNPVLSGILAQQTDEKNYFVKISDEGVDSISGAAVTTVAVGNGYLTSYSTTAAVGALPESTINVEGLNLVFIQGASGGIPALNHTNGQPITAWNFSLPTGNINPGTGDLAISVLRPGDITLSVKEAGSNTNFNEMGVDINNTNIQSYTLSFDIGRESLEKLGSRTSVTRPVTLPVNATLAVETIPGSFSTGSLFSLTCDDTEYDIAISLKVPDCSGNGNVAARFDMKKAKLNSVNYGSSIGSNKNASLNFSCAIAGSANKNQGIFLSGVYI